MTKMCSIKIDKNASKFVDEVNKNKISDELLTECVEASKLFKRKDSNVAVLDVKHSV